MIFYITWIVSEILVVGFSAWLSYKTNLNSKFFVAIYLFSLVQVWPFVAKFSKNLLFDAVLYDLILIITYTSVLIYFTKTDLKIINYIGLGLLFLGMLLFKKGL